jgi:hypothetical protein
MTRYVFAVLSLLAVHPVIGDRYYSAILGCSHRASVVVEEEFLAFGWEPMQGRNHWAFWDMRNKRWQKN